MGITDDQIRGAVINLFKRYDKDNSGYVEKSEITNLCNDLQRELNSKKQFTKDQVEDILNSLDKNQDGRVTKDELFVLMRRLNPE